MADIELVIKIPEEDYKHILHRQKEYCITTSELEDVIASGTPLPKGHGRLIILSEDRLKENQNNLDWSCQKWISEVGLSNAIVKIIKADKAESEDKE